MTALPSAVAATAGTATEGDVKNFLINLRDYLAGLFDTSGLPADAFAKLGLASQSVNYANSAGNADTVDGLHKTAFTSWYWYWTGTLSVSTLYTITHAAVSGNGILTMVPYLECVTADGMFSVGDHLPLSSVWLNDGSQDLAQHPYCNWNRGANQVTFRAVGPYVRALQSNGLTLNLTLVRWRFKVVLISSVV